MLDVAMKYEEKLQLLFTNVMFDEKYKFYGGYYSEKYKSHTSTKDRHEFVSLNKLGEIQGYIGYSIDREMDYVTGIWTLNFGNTSFEFGKDLLKCLDDIFVKFKFKKIKYCVNVGNPVESTYDKLTQKYGGRIVGTYIKDSKLIDGEYYDVKVYEMFLEDYLKNKKRK